MQRGTFGTPRRGLTPGGSILQLQRDLSSLGFSIVGDVDGTFGRRTFWAIREFQTYAAGLEVARVVRNGSSYVETVSTGANRYTGPISGSANPETLALIERWKASNWRCPVVINAWRISQTGRKTAIAAENIWLHDEHKVSSSGVGFFAHDFTNRYVNVGKLPDGSVLLGRYVKYSTFGGPQSEPPRFTTDFSEIVPLTIIGRTYANLNSAERKTFRVVRAVSEVECIGFFDCINAYDNAFVSLGPCHWTLGLVYRSSTGNQVHDGELCGTLAYYAYRASADFNKYIGQSGIRVRQDWIDDSGQPNGARVFQKEQRKYASWLSFQQDDGSFAPVAYQEEEGNYFKGWHWIYRWVALMRESTEMRRAIWDMARVRLRDLGALRVNVSGTDRALSEVFTSEKALAILLRWHVRYPADVANTRAGRYVGLILERAMQSGRWPSDPSRWNNDNETRLVRSMLFLAQGRNSEFFDTIRSVDGWPTWNARRNPRRFKLSEGLTPLSEARNSFELSTAGLPPAPYP